MGNLSDCTLLIAADIPADLKWLVDAFHGQFKLCVALEGRMALEHIQKQQADVIILDVNMTGMDAYKACEDIKNNPETENVGVVFIDRTANDESVAKGYAAGADDYIINPHHELVMRKRVIQLIELVMCRVAMNGSGLSPQIPEKPQVVETQAIPEEPSNKCGLDPAHREVIISLAAAAESPSENTRKHLRRISAFSALLAELSGKDDETVQMISDAVILYDTGKMLIPDYILKKEAPLSKMEWLIMQQHTALGKGLLETSDSPFMKLAREIAATHHENWDGTGYPEKLAGEDIPFAGRVCAIVDTFDALTSERPYKLAFAVEKSLQFMRQKRGTSFDPDLFDIFEKNIDLFVLEMHRINGSNPADPNAETLSADNVSSHRENNTTIH